MAACFAALSLAASASPVAAVTIGQLAPSPSNSCVTGIHVDYLQPSVSSGQSYVVPNDGGVMAWTVTSWSHNPSASSEITMKVFRKVAEPSFYQAVGHDGPRPLTAGLLNTFPVSIPVKAGDVLGLNAIGGTACKFDGDTSLYEGPLNLADGQSASFTGSQGGRLNISAALTPTNAFTVGALRRNLKKGTATLTIEVPNPGEVTVTGPGVSAANARAAATAVAAGRVTIKIRAKGKKRRALNETGKTTLKAVISFTPSGGDPATQSTKLKLKKR